MRAPPHYTAAEIANMLNHVAVGYRLGEHVHLCEQCHFLLALVRRARGEPSDEEGEVTVDALKRWMVNP